MSTNLWNGTVVPSWLTVIDNVGGNNFFNSVTDVSLRMGTISAFYNQSDPQNRNGKFIEYDVVVQRADGTSGSVPTTYFRAVVSSMFGGIADYSRWTPRIDNTEQQTNINIGSKVLLLCLNGDNRLSYIIGGIPHPETSRLDKPFDAHSLDWEYNGVYFNINSDGEMNLYRKGATDNKGDPTNAQSNISTFTMTSDGKVNIGYTAFESTDPSTDGIISSQPGIILDQQSNKITINGASDIETNTTNLVQINTQGGFKINSGSEALLNSTTYRLNQTELHQQLQILLTTLSTLIAAAGAALTAAAADPTFAAVAPIAAPLVGVSGAALTSAQPIIVQMGVALATFEANTLLYLSKTNFQSDPE